ncbi:MAG TPA: hypothetical protein PKJ41_09410 [Bryobacteraceae bacterium]|nr:hypothetical protein [Bryobacteraceae bacterium]HPT25414.1 hypothetical protein [Bryobacteraceae bacterium]
MHPRLNLDRIRRYHFQLLAAALAATGFLLVAVPGLRSGWFPDDLMNIYGAWTTPVARLARDIVAPSEEAYRPVGSLVLKGLFHTFGLDVFPYRVLCFFLLAVNLGLHFLVARAVSRSVTVAGISACLFSAQAFMSDLYLSTATIYDLLAFAFVHAGMLVYLQPRARGEAVSWGRWIALGSCALLAAGSKEVGVVLPVMLLGYEAMFWKGASRRLLGPFLLTLMVGVAAVLPRMASSGLMQSNPAYALKFDLPSIAGMMVVYTRMLLLDNGLRPGVVYAVLGAIAVLAVTWKSAEFRFGVLLFASAAAPLMLIEPRSLYALYIAYSGWCLLLAVPLARIPIPPTITLLVVAAVAGSMNAKAWPLTISWAAPEQARTRCALDALAPLAPRLAHGARVLIVDDPYPPDDSILIFAARLLARDSELQVWRLRSHPQAAEWPEPWSMRVRIAGCKPALE